MTGTDALSAGNLLTRTVTIAVRNAGGLTTAQAATASINGVSSIGSAVFGYQAERTLTAQAAGTVTAINVQEGAEVAKDDILIGLSGDDLTESIQSASESLRSAEISMQNLQDAMNNYTITAPINGTIIEKDAKAGDAAKAGDTLCIVYDLSYLEMSINVDELQISSISVGQKVQITADAVQDKTYEGVVTRVSMKGDTSGGTTTYPVTIRIDDTGSLMPGMNATAALDIPPCQRYVIVKATAGFAVFRLISKSLLFYSCLDFTQNLGKTHFCLTFGVHFSIRSLFFGIFFNVFAIGIYSFDSCFLSTTWIS